MAPPPPPPPDATPTAAAAPEQRPGAQDDERTQGRRAALERLEDLDQIVGGHNTYGAWILLRRELRRFWSIAGQTVVSPVVTTMLYFLVFGYSLGDRLQEVQGVPYIDFLVPGLVMLAMITNGYINNAFSLFIQKIQGTIVDLLVTPLSHAQLLLAYIGAGVVRAMLVGGIIWVVSIIMGANATHNIPVTLAIMLLTGTCFGLLGIIVAILAEEFDHINFFPSFLLTPLTFLGGVFYSIEMLPEPWRTVSLFNPVLYMINGLRYGMAGVSDVPLWQGFALLGGLCAAFFAIAFWLLRSGRKLRE